MYDEGRRHKKLRTDLERARLELARQDRELDELQREMGIELLEQDHSGEVHELLARLFDEATRVETRKVPEPLVGIGLRG